MQIRVLLKRMCKKLGYEIHRSDDSKIEFYKDNDLRTISFVKPYTLTTKERIFALIESVRYVIENNIEGDFVECGVWKGGSVMTMAKVLLEEGQKRDIYLFDTFAGMTKPTDKDKKLLTAKQQINILRKLRSTRITQNCVTYH